MIKTINRVSRSKRMEEMERSEVVVRETNESLIS